MLAGLKIGYVSKVISNIYIEKVTDPYPTPKKSFML